MARGGSRINQEAVHKNGVENSISYTWNYFHVAHAQDPNSTKLTVLYHAGRQLNSEWKYTAFGTVTSGMDVVDAVCRGAL